MLPRLLHKVPRNSTPWCTIAMFEVVMRSAKNIFTVYLQSPDMLNLSCAVSHRGGKHRGQWESRAGDWMHCH